MPLFETDYSENDKLEDGSSLHIHPRVALSTNGPHLTVNVSSPPQLVTHLEPSAVKPISGLALIDTGAEKTAVDEKVCELLGLSPTDVVTLSHAGGMEQRACYPIQLTFPGTPLLPVTVPTAISVNIQPAYVVLFGRDILADLHFTYNGPAGRIEIAF